jgi:multidrug resistance efflux pump
MDEQTPSTPSIPEAKAKKRPQRAHILMGLGIAAVLVAIGSGVYVVHEGHYIYSDKAEVSAPLINLTPLTLGALKAVYVNQGDAVTANQTVARVGDEMIQTRVSGLAVVVKEVLGANYTPGQAVITMIEPKELHVIARISEDKGLKDIYEGQDVIFTVDAFGGQQFHGTVENISDTSHEGDVVFNISDKREEKEFEVKIAYDTTAYPQLQNGMSAKVWIVK